MLELLLGWRWSGCWVRLGERVGRRCWTLRLLSSRSVLAGQYGRLCWHRGQIRRRHHGWRGRCHRWRFRHHGARLPTAAAGLGAGRLPGRLELVGGPAAQLVKLGHGLLGGRLTSGRCRNRLADSVSSSYRCRPALAPSTYPAAMPRVPPVAFCGDQAEPAGHPG